MNKIILIILILIVSSCVKTKIVYVDKIHKIYPLLIEPLKLDKEYNYINENDIVKYGYKTFKSGGVTFDSVLVDSFDYAVLLKDYTIIKQRNKLYRYYINKYNQLYYEIEQKRKSNLK